MTNPVAHKRMIMIALTRKVPDLPATAGKTQMISPPRHMIILPPDDHLTDGPHQARAVSSTQMEMHAWPIAGITSTTKTGSVKRGCEVSNFADAVSLPAGASCIHGKAGNTGPPRMFRALAHSLQHIAGPDRHAHRSPATDRGGHLQRPGPRGIDAQRRAR